MTKSVVKVYVLTGIAALFLLACATLPAGFESAEESVVRHTISGMEFPPQVSGFQRVNVVEENGVRVVADLFFVPSIHNNQVHTAKPL